MIAHLQARGFRNLASQPFVPGPGRQLLLGPNGAGKTSLLEALYVVATTRSFRTAQLGDCVGHGAEGFYLGAEIAEPRAVRLEIGWQTKERVRRVNGTTAPLAEYVGAQPVVAWTAAEAELLGGAPELRRRLLDRVILGVRPAALEVMGRYRRALRHKRELLAAGDPRGLESWNAVLAESAAEIRELRRDQAARLEQAFVESLALSTLDLPPLQLVYRPSPAGPEGGRAEIAAALQRLAPREIQRRLPLAGPHRDDLLLLWRGRELRTLASAGESKALGLLLAAAQGRVIAAAGRDPVLLLDDADAELDRQSLAAVWPAFAACRQLLASSNRPEIWSGLEVDGVWSLEGGRRRPGMPT
jgi:DNA replication and repair protein RecF